LLVVLVAAVLNSFLVWIYWTYALIVFADNNNTTTPATTRCNEDYNTDCYALAAEVKNASAK
jgi:hypothetical protein